MQERDADMLFNIKKILGLLCVLALTGCHSYNEDLEVGSNEVVLDDYAAASIIGAAAADIHLKTPGSIRNPSLFKIQITALDAILKQKLNTSLPKVNMKPIDITNLKWNLKAELLRISHGGKNLSDSCQKMIDNAAHNQYLLCYSEDDFEFMHQNKKYHVVFFKQPQFASSNRETQKNYVGIRRPGFRGKMIGLDLTSGVFVSEFKN